MTDIDTPPLTLHMSLSVTIRPLKSADLPKLELDGQFAKFRTLFKRAYRDQLEGRRLMLVAERGDEIVARLFILFNSADFTIADGETRAYLYSFFVVPVLRGLGLGTHMVEHAEHLLLERGFRYATIAVAKDNEGALKLYQRLGYLIQREDPGRWSYTDHLGQVQRVYEPCWIMEKRLENP